MFSPVFYCKLSNIKRANVGADTLGGCSPDRGDVRYFQLRPCVPCTPFVRPPDAFYGYTTPVVPDMYS